MAANEVPGEPSLDMDAMIDEIIARKGPYHYTEGLHEDTWEEEFEKIPLFMSKPLEEVDPDENPAAAAFQCIKFEEETPEGRAKMHKDEGNDFFKNKKYRKAIDEYTEGIKQNSSDIMMNAILYCNRATAHFYIGNYRSSVKDAKRSCELKPDHLKAYIRGATACIEMLSCDETIEWCDNGLEVEPTNGKLQELRKKAVTLKYNGVLGIICDLLYAQGQKKQGRNERKSIMEEKKQQKEEEKLIAAIKSRGVCLQNDTLTSQNQPPGEGHVHINDNGELIWPVMFLYPEHGQCDYIVAFNENSSFNDHLNAMFSEPPGWDRDRKYHPDQLEVLCGDDKHLRNISSSMTLKEALSSIRPTIKGGTPAFIIIAKNTTFRDHFLNQHSVTS